MMARTGSLRSQRVDQQMRERAAEEVAFDAGGAAQLGIDVVAQRARDSARPDRASSVSASTASCAERSAKKMPSRVIGSTSPGGIVRRASSPGPASALRTPDHEAESDGIGHAYGSSRAPARDPVSSSSSKRAWFAREALPAVDLGVGLRADADRQVIGAREPPDVALRLRHEADHDLARRRPAREEAGRDRKLTPFERAAEPPPHQAVSRTVGADDVPRVPGVRWWWRSWRPRAAAARRTSRHAGRVVASAGGNRAVEERAIEARGGP